MRSQINLLDDITNNLGGMPPALLIKSLVAGMFLAIAAAIAQGYFVNTKYEALESWEDRLVISQNQLLAIQKKFPNISQERQLTQENAVIQDEITKQREILSLLDSGNKLQTKGFYQYLLALSNNVREGIWLTEIELIPGEDKARLKGKSLNPELVPVYIQDLSGTEFSGTNFGRLSLIQISKKPQVYEFEFDSSITSPPLVAGAAIK